jgi:hypothetical protein
VTIVVDNNVATPVTVSVTGVCADGSTTTPVASFGIDHFNVATVSTGGVVTANTAQGGEATLTVTSSTGLTATAKVTVIVHKTLEEVAVDPGGKAALETPLTDGAVTVVYPYDRTMFARGLFAPELMWNEAAPADACLVSLKEDFFEISAFVSGAQPGRWLLNDKLWEGLTASNHGEEVQVNVACLHGATASSAFENRWRVAQGSLRGSITYWAVNKGQIMRISPNAPAAVPVFDAGAPTDVGTPVPLGYNGANPPWNANDSGKRCVACHTVARNGSRLSAVFSAPGSWQPWGAVDLGATPTVKSIGQYEQFVRFQALSPTGAFVVVNTSDMRLSLGDPETGAALSSGLDAYTDKMGAPAFAPDGSKIAFPANATGFEPVEYFTAGLDIADFDPNGAAGGYFVNRRTVRPNDGSCIAFPSFSPGSDHIVYQKGDYSRARGGAGPSPASDGLFLTNLDGSLGDLALGAASGNHLDARNQQRSYQPTVNPIAVGGYMWVVFVSPRDYGNRHVSTGDPGVENNKQLWVSAVDLNPKPGVDPSHPAFRLAGQDLDTINMSGYWSLDACHANGETCEAGYDCCGGYCRPDASGKQVCADGTGVCAKLEEKCVTSADCCKDGIPLVCVGGFCALSKD